MALPPHPEELPIALDRDQLVRLLDSLPDLVAVVGLDGRYLFANAAYQTILGYPPALLVGQPATGGLAASVVSRILDGLQAEIDGTPLAWGEPLRLDAPHAAGHRVELEVRVVLVRDAANVPTGALVVGREAQESMVRGATDDGIATSVTLADSHDRVELDDASALAPRRRVTVVLTPAPTLLSVLQVAAALERPLGTGNVHLLESDLPDQARLALDLPAGLLSLGPLVASVGLAVERVVEEAEDLYWLYLEGDEALRTEPRLAPATFPQLPGTVHVVGYPLVHFSDVNRSLVEIRALPGVKALRPRRLTQGILYLDVEYMHPQPLHIHLRSLAPADPPITWETDEWQAGEPSSPT